MPNARTERRDSSTRPHERSCEIAWSTSTLRCSNRPSRHRPSLATRTPGEARTVVRGALLALTGVAATLSYVWWRHLWVLLLGVVLAGLGASALLRAIRRSPALREQDRMIGCLWALLRRLPNGTVLVDSVTGHELSVERESGFLAFVVAYPADHVAATVTRYMVGFAAAPARPPLFRHVAAPRRSPPSCPSRTAAGWCTSTA